MSNTKLSKLQKESLKTLKAEYPEAKIFSFPMENCTIVMGAVFPGSRMVKIGISWASPNEKKFRRKVGEYNAMLNYEFSTFQMPCNGLDFELLAQDLANFGAGFY